MDPMVKQLWIAALRSGEYIQGSGGLRRGNTYCCLGVLCDIYHKVTGNGTWTEKQFGSYYSFELISTYLPVSVIKWAGLLSNNPHLPDSTLIGAANDHGVNFASIANTIEGSFSI